jgi:glucokinase
MSNPDSQDMILAGDIGGTKTNLGLFQRGKRRPRLKSMETYRNKGRPSLEHIVDLFLKKHSPVVRGACFGIAGPVINGRCKLTNLSWEVSEKRLKKRFGWKKVKLMNDLAATALALPVLTKRELVALNQKKAAKGENLGLIAPGTGLGMALLVCKDGEYVPVSSEGGHSDFAPNSQVEMALWQYLHQRLGHVSVERILSGPGLFIVYCWLKFTGHGEEPAWLADRMEREDPAKVISEAALVEEVPLCSKTLDIFVAALGACAGNLALTGLTSGGIYLGGGIPPKILPKLQEDVFLRAFTNKGRFEGLLKTIPVSVVRNDKAALIGAARCALDMTEAFR